MWIGKKEAACGALRRVASVARARLYRDGRRPAVARGQRCVARAPVAQNISTRATPASRRRGGQTGRTVALVGLGDIEVPELDLRSNASRFAILKATLGAVVRGNTSGMVATTIVSIVKLAAELARHDQEDKIAELERRLEDLVVDSRVRR